MFTLFLRTNRRWALGIELPSFVISLVIAELFYKFHSFSLECLAFSATWMAIGAMLYGAGRLMPRAEQSPQS
jgi:hypothetical protein